MDTRGTAPAKHPEARAARRAVGTARLSRATGRRLDDALSGCQAFAPTKVASPFSSNSQQRPTARRQLPTLPHSAPAAAPPG